MTRLNILSSTHQCTRLRTISSLGEPSRGEKSGNWLGPESSNQRGDKNAQPNSDAKRRDIDPVDHKGQQPH